MIEDRLVPTCRFCGSEVVQFCPGCQYFICEDCDWIPEIQGRHDVSEHQSIPYA